MITGNYFNKYESKNPLVKLMMRRFKARLDRYVKRTKAVSILDVGCGEGYLTSFIQHNNPVSIQGIDITPEIIAKARKIHPDCQFAVGSAYDIAYPDSSFDLVTINEVLEHLDDPEKAIVEVKRVSKRFVICSVPWEPWWRVVNMLRFKYWSRLGNTPGHVNHWTRYGFKRMLERHFSKVRVVGSTLWTFALCEK